MRIDHGPGYRRYFIPSGPVFAALLAGSDKSTQDADSKRAVDIAKEWTP
jgi:putative addiction module killer protein